MTKKADTKRVLIDTTKELLKSNSHFTVKEIAEKAFTNIAAINYHFHDKNTLLDVALTEIMMDFKSLIEVASTRNYDSYEQAIEYFLSLVFDFYIENKGAIKHLLFTDDISCESRFIEHFLMDQTVTNVFLQRLAQMTGEKDADVLLYKYMIAVSAFLLPILVECRPIPTDEKFSLSSLQQEGNRKIFIMQILKLFQ